MRNRKFVIFSAIVLSLGGLNCKEVYAPPAILNNPHLLVVDGIVISGNDSTVITLSRTRTISDSVPPDYELNAKVSVVSVTGTEYPFLDEGNGRYKTSQLTLDASQLYQLKIITGDGNEFRSELNPVHPSPPIDSVFWTLDSAGVHIYLNTHDPTNNTKYYRWEYVETWEYQSAYNSFLEYIDADNIIFRPLTNQIYRCYQTRPSSIIEVANTTRLSIDTVNKYEVTMVPTGSEKITVHYSDLVKQYAIPLEAFNFWQNLKKNTEQLGSLFDLQPFTELGNIKCVNNPAVKCIGFISFTTLQEKRIFIDNIQILPWDYSPYYNIHDPCMVIEVPPPFISDYFTPPGGPYGYSMIGQGLDSTHSTVYLLSSKLCVDCRIHGGSTIKPAFFQ